MCASAISIVFCNFYLLPFFFSFYPFKLVQVCVCEREISKRYRVIRVSFGSVCLGIYEGQTYVIRNRLFDLEFLSPHIYACITYWLIHVFCSTISSYFSSIGLLWVASCYGSDIFKGEFVVWTNWRFVKLFTH